MIYVTYSENHDQCASGGSLASGYLSPINTTKRKLIIQPSLASGYSSPISKTKRKLISQPCLTGKFL